MDDKQQTLAPYLIFMFHSCICVLIKNWIKKETNNGIAAAYDCAEVKLKGEKAGTESTTRGTVFSVCIKKLIKSVIWSWLFWWIGLGGPASVVVDKEGHVSSYSSCSCSSTSSMHLLLLFHGLSGVEEEEFEEVEGKFEEGKRST